MEAGRCTEIRFFFFFLEGGVGGGGGGGCGGNLLELGNCSDRQAWRQREKKKKKKWAACFEAGSTPCQNWLGGSHAVSLIICKNMDTVLNQRKGKSRPKWGNSRLVKVVRTGGCTNPQSELQHYLCFSSLPLFLLGWFQLCHNKWAWLQKTNKKLLDVDNFTAEWEHLLLKFFSPCEQNSSLYTFESCCIDISFVHRHKKDKNDYTITQSSKIMLSWNWLFSLAHICLSVFLSVCVFACLSAGFLQNEHFHARVQGERRENPLSVGITD